ncbi:hypothetical protein BDN70DRAFT_317455 [Pholiota conissans]|uniref:Uncharacterized protein n=1 Tax=Pholiota conissans TaxID=109636 RepID=A0A9P6CXV6_9AGAR|nr:hypothetical protein BDN70DRAFT_317455 [Pholiota conissans]
MSKTSPKTRRKIIVYTNEVISSQLFAAACEVHVPIHSIPRYHNSEDHSNPKTTLDASSYHREDTNYGYSSPHRLKDTASQTDPYARNAAKPLATTLCTLPASNKSPSSKSITITSVG